MTKADLRLLSIAALVTAAVAGTLAFEAALSRGQTLPFGHTRYGHAFGWAGLLLTLLVFVYPVRKRHSPARRWPHGWFQVHMAAGVLGPLLIFLHSGAHYHALVPVLALVSLVIVALSGIIGQAVHALALRGLNDQRRLLQHDGLSNGEIDLRLHRLASEEKAFRLWQVIHAPMTILCVALILIHMTGAWFFAGFL
jgi:hypothetical protein